MVSLAPTGTVMGICATIIAESWNLPPAPGGLSPPGVSAVRGTMVTRMRQRGCCVTCTREGWQAMLEGGIQQST